MTPSDSASYEYRTVTIDPAARSFFSGTSKLDPALNDLTAEGWEIVSTAATSRGFLLFGIGQLSPVLTVLLRRRRGHGP